MFETVGIIAKEDDLRVIETCRSLVAYLDARGIPYLLDRECAAAVPEEVPRFLRQPFHRQPFFFWLRFTVHHSLADCERHSSPAAGLFRPAHAVPAAVLLRN